MIKNYKNRLMSYKGSELNEKTRHPFYGQSDRVITFSQVLYFTYKEGRSREGKSILSIG